METLRKVGGGEKLKNKSKQHYSWWSYIKEIIREYPDMRTASTSGVTAREVDAVSDAVYATERTPAGDARLKVIRMVHWDGTHTLAGAALEIPCSERTAARWQRKFFEEVARNRGLLD